MDALRAGNRTVSMDHEDFPDLPDPAQGMENRVAEWLGAAWMTRMGNQKHAPAVQPAQPQAVPPVQ